MEKTKDNSAYSYIFNLKERKSSKFKSSANRSNIFVLYKEIDLSPLFEELEDKRDKNENENGEYSWINDYNSFLDEKYKISESKAD